VLVLLLLSLAIASKARDSGFPEGARQGAAVVAGH
jgi:hypothetical protein